MATPSFTSFKRWYHEYMIIEIVGWIGTAFVVLAYFLVSTKRIKPVSKQYQFLNAFGALGIIVNSVVHHAIPSVGLNVIWLFIALVEFIRTRKKS